MRIYKYELEIIDHQAIQTGKLYAIPLSVAEQSGKLMLWAATYEDGSLEEEYEIVVDIVGTGHPYNDAGKPYIGTVVMSYGAVWHVFAEWRHQDES